LEGEQTRTDNRGTVVHDENGMKRPEESAKKGVRGSARDTTNEGYEK